MAVQKGFVLLVASDGLGRGNDDLGRLLMLRFLHQLGTVEVMPEEVLFTNYGVKLVADDSPVLEQLRRLEAEGVELLACSTCLDRLGLIDKVAVGQKSNMAEIVSALTRAQKVVSL